MTNTRTANVAKRRPFAVPARMAHFGRFGGISRQNGTTDRPAAEMPVKRKSGKNKCWPVRPGPGRPKTFS